MPSEKNNYKYPLVSITMIIHNRKDDVRESLIHIFKIVYPNYEVIVVDNISTDGVTEMIEKEFPQVKLKKLSENKPLRARNISFQIARGKYIVTLDDDSYPEPDVITKMIDRFENDPCLGIIAFQIPCGDYFSTEYWLNSEHSLNTWYIGSGAAVRREVFQTIGYYDETLGGYAEEFDFSYRALSAGYVVGHFKDLIAHHRPRKNKNRFFRFFFQNERNQQYLMGKFIYPIYWPVLFARSTFFRLLRAYYLEGTKALFWAIIGNTWGILYIFKGYFRRVNVPIVIEYYLLRARGYVPSFWHLTMDRRDRKIIAKNLKKKYFDHSQCPRFIDYQKILNSYYVKIPDNLRRYGALQSKINVTNCRKDEREKNKILNTLNTRLNKLKEKVVGEMNYYDPEEVKDYENAGEKRRKLWRKMLFYEKMMKLIRL